jgi:hypothetical protein
VRLGTPGLLVKEDRRALFQESHHTFLGIMGRDDAGECRLLNGQAVVDGGVHATMHSRQRSRERQRRLRRQLRREGKGSVEQVSRGHDPVDQAKPGGLGGVEGSPGQDQLQRGFPPDVARQVSFALNRLRKFVRFASV